ncbi:hypothetical protein GEMRC1_001261 [Eukaryota sp. GEM-RC1]
MECFHCCESFNLSNRLPLLICGEGHTACSKCSAELNKCPLCATNCLKERKVNCSVQDLVRASLHGDLCPQIPPDEIILGERIAEGGFTIVYAATWFDLPVAVKMLSLTQEGKLKLQQQLNLLINLNHPSILRVFGISVFQDSIGIVMERASSSIPSPNSLTSSTLRYAKELCQAVKFLHLKSVVHGDLKPANILLVDDHVRVADFGTSKNLSATTLVPRSFDVSYTYAAPEQFRNVVSPLNDIYSLGVCLYELFENKVAFSEEDPLSIIDAKNTGKALPFGRSVPECVQKVIQKCMNPDPLCRPKINQIIEVLNNVQDLEAVAGDFSTSSTDESSLKVRNDHLVGEILKLNQQICRLDQEITLSKKREFEIIGTKSNHC